MSPSRLLTPKTFIPAPLPCIALTRAGPRETRTIAYHEARDNRGSKRVNATVSRAATGSLAASGPSREARFKREEL